MIHFMMILVNFGVFSLMLTDIRTDGPTDWQMDRPSYRDVFLTDASKIVAKVLDDQWYLSLSGCVVVGGAAAPKGPMTFAFTHRGNFSFFPFSVRPPPF